MSITNFKFQSGATALRPKLVPAGPYRNFKFQSGATAFPSPSDCEAFQLRFKFQSGATALTAYQAVPTTFERL